MKRFPFAKGKRARHVPGTMNKTEARFHDYLKVQYQIGALLNFGFEEFTLKLAKDLRYTPDFWAQNPEGEIEFYEVKGTKKHTVKAEDGTKIKTGRLVPYFGDEGAKPKLAVAADKFPFRFVVAFEDTANKGNWMFEEYTQWGETA